MLRLALLLALVVAALGLVAVRPASAQVSPTVADGGVENKFPGGMVFRVSTQSDSPIQRIRLHYTVLPDGTAASTEADFQPATSVSTSFTLEGNNPPRIYLPPGTTIRYHWEVTDADGDTAATQPATFFYDDIRFRWTSLEEDGITVYYYSGSERDAQAMLTEAGKTIASVCKLLGVSVNFPVKVWIYRSVQEMRPALARRSETFEQSVTTAGVRVSSDTVLVLGNVSFITLRHELTHVVTAVAGEGPFGSLPAWLDEGTAVYGQGDPGGYREALNRAVAHSNLLSIRSISSYPGDPAKVDLFYGQSWGLVSYLIDEHGAEKFARLFAEIKSGKRTDEALMSAYGFDQDGLEDEWRASLGLAPRQEPSPSETPQPTATKAPPVSSRPGPNEDGGGTSTWVIVGVALGVAALAGVVGLAGLALARRMR